MNLSKKATITIIILIVMAIVSMFIIGPIVSSADNMSAIIQSLDEKQDTAMKISLVTTALAIATKAETMSDINMCMILVLTVILLEKYLLTLLGAATFKILIPIACVLGIASVVVKKEKIKETTVQFAFKLAVLGLGLFLAIPSGVLISDMVYDTHKASISQSVEEAGEVAAEIDVKEEEGEEGIWGSIVSFAKKIGKGISNVGNSLVNKLNNLIESAIVMLVTTCLIPILVILFDFWLIKQIMGIDIKPKLPLKSVKKLEAKADESPMLTDGE